MSWWSKALGLNGLYRGAVVPLLLAVACPNSGIVPAFAADKVIEVDPQHRSDPVMITKVTLGDSEVQCGLIASPFQLQPVVPIQAGDDWLQNVTIYLFNRTNKTVVYVQIVLGFPETGDGIQRPMRVHHITLGQLPPSVAVTGSGQPIRRDLTRKAMSFAPGQTLLIDVGVYFDQIRASVEPKMAFTAITKCIIRRSAFYFDDGMRWDGEYSVPDPERPGKWKYMDQRYFPGDEHNNWPPRPHK